MNETIIRGIGLKKPNINFHPAPPWFPGRGGASLAIYDRYSTYGATAHKMVRNVDAGEIYYVEDFEIDDCDTCETVYNRASVGCYLLLRQFLDHIRINNKFPEPTKYRWEGMNTTKKEFKDFLTITDKDDFLRKVKACKHSKFPGPYIFRDGFKFELSKEE